MAKLFILEITFFFFKEKYICSAWGRQATISDLLFLKKYFGKTEQA